MASRAEEYRRLAQHCLELVHTISDKNGRAALIQMAQVWQRLAEEQETAAQQQPKKE